MSALAVLTLLVAGAVAGYLAGRHRPLERLDNRVNPWVWKQIRHPAGKRRPGWWAAQVYCLGFIALHPIEATENRRAYKRDEARSAEPVPVPQRDPDWAAKRSAATREEGGR